MEPVGETLSSYKNEGRGYCPHHEKWMKVVFWTREPKQLSFRGAEKGLLLHRADGPAVIWENGTEEYRSDGLLHREADKPAFIGADGALGWWVDGVKHRIGGPACIYPDGEVHWKQNGKYHREDGPAWLNSDGSYVWYLNGKHHRDGDKPAVRSLEPGVIYLEWCKEGELSRDPALGPAAITRFEDGGGQDKYAVGGLRLNHSGAAVVRRSASGRVSRKYYLLNWPLSKAEFVALHRENFGVRSAERLKTTDLVEGDFWKAYLLD